MRVIPTIYWEAWQEESVVLEAGAAQNRRNTGVIPQVSQQIFKIPGEAAIFLGKCKRIGERLDRGAKLLLNDLFRPPQFVFNLVRSKRPQIRMRSEEHTSELQSLAYLVCRLLLEK